MLRQPSGLTIEGSAERLAAFSAEEYAYYDAIPSGDPDAVQPLDVRVTVAVNSYITNAAQARTIHRGLARTCDPILPSIPADADLLASDPRLEAVQALLDAACAVRCVLMPVATKVLHRKRRNLARSLCFRRPDATGGTTPPGSKMTP